MTQQTAQSRLDVKVGLIGEKASGKTNLFMDLPFALDNGLHGYPLSWSLKIQPANSATRLKVKDYRRSDPEVGTSRLVEGQYRLHHPAIRHSDETGALSKDPTVTTEFELQDAPGETQFPTNSGGNPFPDQRDSQNDWLRDAGALIITLPAFRLFDPGALTSILDYLSRIEADRLRGLKRVVVAITMFDLLMFRFRDRALELAAIPSFVREILKVAISDDTLDHLKYFEIDHLTGVDIRFIAVSSWGFIPNYGCSNLDPNGVKPDGAEFGQRFVDVTSRKDDPKSAKRFPYMAADPMIYAITGFEHRFFFRLEQLTDGV